jgi:2-iminobutanoate/2-iminopropanoate deaminase
MRIPGRRDFMTKLAAIGGLGALVSRPASAQPRLLRRFVKRDASQTSGYSQAVVIQGGRTIYLAGHATAVDASGKSLAGDFEGQVRAVFAFMQQTLETAGGKLSDIVTMTVFITDPRHHSTLTKMRHDLLGDNFPASAVVCVEHLANPALLLEIQGIAIVA